MSPPIAKVLDFLSSLVSAEKSVQNDKRPSLYALVNFRQVGRLRFGQAPTGSEIDARGIQQETPAPIYSRFWEVDSVIEFLISLGQLNTRSTPYRSRSHHL
jgi:hypothetical protein